MPTDTFNLSAATDDGYVQGSGASYPPAANAANDNAGSAFARRQFTGATYVVRNGLVRFNTASIPDDATITAAYVECHIRTLTNADTRSLVLEYYDHNGIDTGDYTATSGGTGTIGATIALSGLTTGAAKQLTLTDLSGISKTGITGFRLHISGGQPTGDNNFEFATDENASQDPPRLVVTYTVGVEETPTAGGGTGGGNGPAARVAGAAGGGVGQGNSPSASTTATAGGGVGAGVSPTTVVVTFTAGGAVGAGHAPSESVTENATSGGGSAGGSQPSPAVTTSTGGATGAGAAPPGAVVTATAGGGVGGGHSPTVVGLTPGVVSLTHGARVTVTLDHSSRTRAELAHSPRVVVDLTHRPAT